MPPRRPEEEKSLAVLRLEAVRRGEPGAWKELVAAYGPLVLSVARRHGLPDEDCEEVFQETWVSLFQQLGEIRRPGSLVAWIVRTAQRQSWFVRRRRAGTRSREDVEPDPESPALPPDDELESLERAQLVQDAVEELGEPCRTLCRALFFDRETPSYEDLARRLERSPGSIGPTRLRCLADLARILERHGIH